MRKISEYGLNELAQLTFVKDFLKEKRNDFMFRRYIGKAASQEKDFLDRCKALAGGNIISIIAFEQPLVLGWLLALCKVYLSEFEILVFDNSLRSELRKDIEEVCRKHGARYLALPPNRTRHVNRSHGLAMSWVYHRIVRHIKPRYFGYLDHDMLPIGNISIIDKLQRQPVYGVANPGNNNYWNLWAGYCFFDYAQIGERPLNFLYDFTRYLDTGGRNWDVLYKGLDIKNLDFAPLADREIKLESGATARTVQFVDDQWIHIGGISYNNNFDEKRVFFTEYVSQMI